MLSLLMGAVFEMPVIAWFLAKTGMLKAEFLRKHRKKAIVVLLIVAAIITPTSDIFTLLLVFAPVYMLYEVSIFIMHKSARDGKPHCP